MAGRDSCIPSPRWQAVAFFLLVRDLQIRSTYCQHLNMQAFSWTAPLVMCFSQSGIGMKERSDNVIDGLDIGEGDKVRVLVVVMVVVVGVLYRRWCFPALALWLTVSNCPKPSTSWTTPARGWIGW
ncbi:hypothetical protein QBC41DRAFT_69698 [Cercophora samala]|uniref:Uncharacterized protein n=1 Tax=Cercophora samala TaxID=330535 RepID=A0AA39ZMN5_9PEZI|nr:hypothetical protein QBC41DRAFT_69698 [Cercophora samala]